MSHTQRQDDDAHPASQPQASHLQSYRKLTNEWEEQYSQVSNPTQDQKAA